MVTGSGLRPTNPLQVSSRAGASSPPVVTKAGSNAAMNSPRGMKYMFAIECSNPAATKTLIGGTIARMRSAVVRAL